MSAPSKRICPDVGASRPASNPSRVLFPLPEAPMIATNWPRSTAKSMPFRISTVWVPVSIRFDTCRATMAAPLNWFDIYPLYLLFWHRVVRYSLFPGLLILISCGAQKPVDQPPAEPARRTVLATPGNPDTRPAIRDSSDDSRPSLPAGAF